MRRIYLDHSATTPVAPSVLEAMMPYLSQDFGNPSSHHTMGQMAKKALDESREKVSALLGPDPEEIIFTNGGTESNNLAIKGVSQALRDKGRHIITSAIEHPSILNSLKFMEKEGYRITYLKVDSNGIVDPMDVKENITNETILVTIIHANNEIGTIEPIAEIGKICKEMGVYLHSDAVQSAGKIPLSMDDLNVDLLSLAAHKIYGPKGVGALYIRRGTKISPLFHGGYQEKSLRAGTENVAGIAGLGKACELAMQDMNSQGQSLHLLRSRLEKSLQERVPDIRINGHPKQRLPHILNIAFQYIEGESLLLNLDMRGIYVSTGSACASGAMEPSHVVLALGVPPQVARGSIRFSLGKDNTIEEIDYTVGAIEEIVKRLRAMSPLYRDREKTKE